MKTAVVATDNDDRIKVQTLGVSLKSYDILEVRAPVRDVNNTEKMDINGVLQRNGRFSQ